MKEEKKQKQTKNTEMKKWNKGKERSKEGMQRQIEKNERVIGWNICGKRWRKRDKIKAGR